MAYAEAEKCTLIGLFTNVLLALSKLIVGLLAGSTALLVHAGDSVSDILATSVSLIGVRVGKRPPDHDHHLGHGNAEAMAGLAVSGGILLNGVGFVAMAIVIVVKQRYVTPKYPAIFAALATMGVKEALYQYTIRVARRTNSPAVAAAAKDHRADVLSSFAAVIGIAAGMYGKPILDPIAAIIIAGFIIQTGYTMMLRNANILMAGSPGAGIELKIMKKVYGIEGVRGIHDLKVQQIGPYYSVLLDITVDKDISVKDGHAIANVVRDKIGAADPNIKDIIIHVDPELPEGEDTSELGSKPSAPRTQ